ncbi:MAG TPA: hypothetical protein VGM90_35260 [Kofleriaceae bacterium]
MITLVAIIAGIGVVIGARLFTADNARTRRVLRRARVVPIAELVDGQLACIVGTIEADGEPLVSMMSRTRCVAFDTSTSSLDGNLVSTKVTRHAVAFFVVDKTGRARIDAPQIALCNKPTLRSDRFEERVLEVGATVRLVGSVSLDPTIATHSEHTYRAGQFTATLSGTVKYPLLADTER